MRIIGLNSGSRGWKAPSASTANGISNMFRAPASAPYFETFNLVFSLNEVRTTAAAREAGVVAFDVELFCALLDVRQVTVKSFIIF